LSLDLLQDSAPGHYEIRTSFDRQEPEPHADSFPLQKQTPLLLDPHPGAAPTQLETFRLAYVRSWHGHGAVTTILLPNISAGLRLIDTASRMRCSLAARHPPTRKGGSAASACEPAARSLRGFSLHRHRRPDIITIAPCIRWRHGLHGGRWSGRVQLAAVANKNPRSWPATLPPRPPRLVDVASTLPCWCVDAGASRILPPTSSQSN
jgi:hypothetical protein